MYNKQDSAVLSTGTRVSQESIMAATGNQCFKNKSFSECGHVPPVAVIHNCGCRKVRRGAPLKDKDAGFPINTLISEEPLTSLKPANWSIKDQIISVKTKTKTNKTPLTL